MLSYRAHFKPSQTLREPHAILATAVIAADTDAEAERIAASADLTIVRRAKGEYLPLASPAEAAAYPYTPIDRERIARQRERLIVGGIDNVTRRLLKLDRIDPGRRIDDHHHDLRSCARAGAHTSCWRKPSRWRPALRRIPTQPARGRNAL